MRGKVWLGVAVSAVLLWVAVRGVSLDEVLQQLRQVHPAWLVPVIVSIFLRFWLTALRWQLLLRPVKRIGVHRLFAITMIGFMANNVLPARLGEFVRAYALGRSESLPPSLPVRDDRDRADLRRLHAPPVPGGRAVLPPAEPDASSGRPR